jgi:hypothetical protein
MLAFDNGNPDTAEWLVAIAFFLALVAAILYALGSRRTHHTTTTVEGHHTDVLWLAPVMLSLAVASLNLAWWVG